MRFGITITAIALSTALLGGRAHAMPPEECVIKLELLAAQQVLRGNDDADKRYLRGRDTVPETDFLDAVMFPRGDKVLIMVDGGKPSRVWDVKEKKLGPPIEAMWDPSNIIKPHISEDGKRAVGMVVDSERKFAIAHVDLETGKVVSEVRLPKEASFHRMSQDGRYVLYSISHKPERISTEGLSQSEALKRIFQASAEVSHDLYVADTTTGETVRRLADHQTQFREGDFSPSGELVVTSARDGLTRIERISDGARLGAFGYGSKIDSISFPKDEKTVFLSTRDGAGYIMSTETPTAQPVPLPASLGSIHSGSYLPTDPPRIVLNTDTGHVVWDPVARKSLNTLVVDEGDIWVGTPVYSPDGKRYITALGDGSTHLLWDAETGAPIAELDTKDPTYSGENVFSRDSKTIAAINRDNAARLWMTTDPDGRPGHLVNQQVGQVVKTYTSDRRIVITTTKNADGSHSSTLMLTLP